MIEVLPAFAPRFLEGLVVNLEIAMASLAVGAAAGLPLAALLASQGLPARAASLIVAALRAAPTFVVMFFLLNVMPRDYAPFGVVVRDWGMIAVILSQAVYAAAYIADNGAAALRSLRAGDTAAAVIFLPSLARAFCVLLMSSGVAAAVGIPEAIFITIREAERMPDIADRVALCLTVMLFFAVLMQSAFALIDRARSRLLRWLERSSNPAGR